MLIVIVSAQSSGANFHWDSWCQPPHGGPRAVAELVKRQLHQKFSTKISRSPTNSTGRKLPVSRAVGWKTPSYRIANVRSQQAISPLL